MLSIVDYGLANLRSVQKAFAAVGHEARFVTTPDEIRAADKLVLPGVGAVADALRGVRGGGLEGPIVEHCASGKPFLGICLGLQMLFETCHEGGVHRGLGILRGEVVPFDLPGLKVPHMGWNTLDIVHDSPLTRDLEAGASVYFVHGYHALCADEADVATTTDYGRPFVSSVRRGNVMAVQFHPEKSQRVGLKMLANFAAL